MNDTPQHPPALTPPPKRMPLFIIKMFLFAALIMLSLSFFALSYITGEDDVLEYQAAALIDEFAAAKKPGEITVITMGDSRSRYAWRYGDDPQKTLTLPDGRTLRSLKISHDVGIFQQFESLEEPIMKAHPDILVMQMDLLYRLQEDPGKLSKIRKLPYLMAFKALLWSGTEDLEWIHQHTDRACTHNYTRGGFEQRVRRLFLSAPADPLGEEMQEAHAFIERMLDAGIKVVMLHIPPNIDGAIQLGIDPIKLDNLFLDALPEPEELAPNGLAAKLEWIYFKEHGKVDDFCDLVHMDKEISEDFAQWFKAQIVRLAAPAPGN